MATLWIPWITYTHYSTKKKQKHSNIFQLPRLCFAEVELRCTAQSHFTGKLLRNTIIHLWRLFPSQKGVEKIAVGVTVRHSFYMCIKQVWTEKDHSCCFHSVQIKRAPQAVLQTHDLIVRARAFKAHLCPTTLTSDKLKGSLQGWTTLAGWLRWIYGAVGNPAADPGDSGSHLAGGGSRSWRWAPGAASPGVGGGGCCVPSPASRRLLAAPRRRACSPRASAGQRCAPRTPCGSCAAAASQPHVLVKQRRDREAQTVTQQRGRVMGHHYFFICSVSSLKLSGITDVWETILGCLERQSKPRTTFIHPKGRGMYNTKCGGCCRSSPLLWLRNSSVKIGMSNTVRSFPSVSFCL